MSSTHPTNTRQSISNRATGYSDNDKLLEAGDWAALRPSGAFLSTVLDLAKWDSVLYTSGILSDSTRQQMWNPVTLKDGSNYPYGFGWQLASLRGHRMVHHAGGIAGFRAHFARFVDDRLTIIILMNLDDVDPEAIMHGVAGFYLPPVPSGGFLSAAFSLLITSA